MSSLFTAIEIEGQKLGVDNDKSCQRLQTCNGSMRSRQVIGGNRHLHYEEGAAKHLCDTVERHARQRRSVVGRVLTGAVLAKH